MSNLIMTSLVKALLDGDQAEAIALVDKLCEADISGLISTVIPQVRQVKELIGARGMRQIKVIAGGAALKQSSAGSLNVDYVAQTTFDGLHYLNQITGGK